MPELGEDEADGSDEFSLDIWKDKQQCNPIQLLPELKEIMLVVALQEYRVKCSFLYSVCQIISFLGVLLSHSVSSDSTHPAKLISKSPLPSSLPGHLMCPGWGCIFILCHIGPVALDVL